MNNYAKYALESEYHWSTFVHLLNYRAENQPEKTAYTFLKSRETEVDNLTYKELHLQVLKIAATLQSLNAVGERALLLYQPGLDFITAFFGCLYAGVIAVPAYPPRRNRNLSRLQAIAQDAQAKILLTSTSVLSSLQTTSEKEGLNLSQLNWIATDDLSSDVAQAWQPQELDSNTIAFLQYTSGSTGNPKGVMVSHNNLLANSAIIHKLFGHTPNSQGLIWLPPYHDMGLIGGILQPLYGGFPVALMASVDFLQKPIRWLQAISDYKATTSGGPNFAYDLCISKVSSEQLTDIDLSSWEVAFTGAEPVRAETLEKFVATFAPYGFRKEAFYPCYGMAETTLIVSGGEKKSLPVTRTIAASALEQNRIVSVNQSGVDSRTIVGCGQIPIEHQVVIVHPETLTMCNPEQVGEIWVAGSSVAQGYWNQVEETEKTFHAYLPDGQGPFLRTGDLGFLQDGELFFTGRIKDVIIIRGQNHYPQDIELTVENSHPSLRLGCGAAFSIDFKGSEQLVIIHEVERNYLRKLNVQEVVENMRQAVVAQHGLDISAAVLVKTGSIPKTSSGKIRRQTCRTMFLAGGLDVVEDWSQNPESKAKFKHLQAEVESILQQLTTK
jgi:acyl-CoA synthetase (AMP-forming)/AMP-acid ligase II